MRVFIDDGNLSSVVEVSDVRRLSKVLIDPETHKVYWNKEILCGIGFITDNCFYNYWVNLAGFSSLEEAQEDVERRLISLLENGYLEPFDEEHYTLDKEVRNREAYDDED